MRKVLDNLFKLPSAKAEFDFFQKFALKIHLFSKLSPQDMQRVDIRIYAQAAFSGFVVAAIVFLFAFIDIANNSYTDWTIALQKYSYAIFDIYFLFFFPFFLAKMFWNLRVGSYRFDWNYKEKRKPIPLFIETILGMLVLLVAFRNTYIFWWVGERFLFFPHNFLILFLTLIFMTWVVAGCFAFIVLGFFAIVTRLFSLIK